jgi:hypothetical protein
MLNLDHPDTDATLAIAHADVAVLSIAKRMTLVGASQKAALLESALLALDGMERVSRQKWGNDQPKLSAIEQLRLEMRALAALDSSNDFSIDAQGKTCSVCSSAITSLPGFLEMTYCPHCLRTIRGGRHAVDRAFGLWAI